MSVLEVRVVLTSEDYDNLVRFYRDGLGLSAGAMWTNHGRGQLLHGGRGVVEILDTEHAASVDAAEVGQRVSGAVRFAFEVQDIQAAVTKAQQYGATLLYDPIRTPWNHMNARVVAPDGMQITLYQVLEEASDES